MQQPTNRDIADMLSETAKLMELHGANEFKIKSLNNAAFTISRLESQLCGLSQEETEQIKGIGNSISQKITLILQTGTLPEYESYLEQTPKGVLEMMHIKGIGPKKVAILWNQLGVTSPGELLYACNENRLIELKGFGAKTQEQIRKAIAYTISMMGFFHFAALDGIAAAAEDALKQTGMFTRISRTGELRRKCELVQQIEMIAVCENQEAAIDKLKLLDFFRQFNAESSDTGIVFNAPDGIRIQLYLVRDESFFKQLFLTTGNSIHLEKLNALKPFENSEEHNFSDEESIYSYLGLSYIEPELREGLEEVSLALKHDLPELINFDDLRGCLHNHSTYSDGLNTLKEMAMVCRDAGYEYLGICDHSKSAFYANGMSEERIVQQHAEVDLLNKELQPFKIFKGIESDILHDGGLDYADHVLRHFDFIVASVHSGLKMTEDKATDRLLKAISNPFTTILGHPTGRLLLAREGYPIDHKKVIDACAVHNVVIELNAHPYRLDLDWRWIRYAMSKNVMISINPDAHHVSGLHDMYYGVCVARKGCLTKAMTFNSRSLSEIENWFGNRRNYVSETVLK